MTVGGREPHVVLTCILLIVGVGYGIPVVLYLGDKDGKSVWQVNTERAAPSPTPVFCGIPSKMLESRIPSTTPCP